jgi:hypothetical protein
MVWASAPVAAKAKSRAQDIISVPNLIMIRHLLSEIDFNSESVQRDAIRRKRQRTMKKII